MVWNKKPQNPIMQRKSQVLLSLILVLVLGVSGASSWIYLSGNDEDSEQLVAKTEQNDQAIVAEEQSPPEVSVEEEVAAVKVVDTQKLQAAIDNWVSAAGQSSVVIADESGEVLASKNPEQKYFAASLYKLYVAYVGYQQVDAGVVDASEVYLNGQTRAECLDLMIRESDSPCAEKLWVELGKQNITDQLVSIGIVNTSMTALNTTAADAASLLGLIAAGEGLSEESQKNYLASMKDQIFRDALNVGFSSDITVYNKIGFNEQVEYHDTAIIETPEGTRYIVSVLTERVGTSKIAELGRALEPIL
ncbi:MAG: beta-lactamase class A [Candidatus Saccharimonadales bacterium]|jgi:beta-lactamase class A